MVNKESNTFKAAIDIGSNSTNLIIGNFIQGKIIVAKECLRVTSLGRGLAEKNLLKVDSKKLTFETLKEYRSITKSFNIDPNNILITGTEALRRATNSNEFLNEIELGLGLKVNIITPEAEAYLTALGTSLNQNRPQFNIMDMGGASTELIRVKKRPFSVEESISIPIGAAVATDYLNAGNEEQFENILQSFNVEKFNSENFIAVAGGMTTIASVLLNLESFKEDLVHGSSVTINQLKNLYNLIESLSPDEILEKYPIIGKRSHVFKGCLYFAVMLLERINCPKIEISTYGLRHGLLALDQIEQRFLYE